MSATSTLVHRDPNILGGTPVFAGTRVPIRSLFDHLEAGDSLNEFLEDFPSVTREQAVATLRLDSQLLVASTNRLVDLVPLMPSVLAALGSVKPGDVVEVTI